MQVAKLKASGAADVMKSEKGNDSVDNFIRQAIAKEPFLSFTRTGDSPIQWIQLLHALDQQAELPGWPLMSPVKVQMQKCEKCSREFCSTINFRRHNRLHRRSLNLDKDSSSRNREFLKLYWDKLSSDAAMDIVSFQDVSLEEVAGSSIIKAMSAFIRKHGCSFISPSYIKAGGALLDIVQGKPSRFPLTSQELFSILDDASEKTFLCAGMADSLQKYVFDGEAGKVGLELRNLVACTSFLIEQKLVKAWLADKDAEALRCQKLLVEEEEAAQKRRAELLERKRQKKLRQKEQKAKAQATEDGADCQEESAETSDSGAPSPPSLNPHDPSDSSLGFADVNLDPLSLPHEPYQVLNDVENHGNNELQSDKDGGCSEIECQIAESRSTLHRNGRTFLANSRCHVPRFQREQNGFHLVENFQGVKAGIMQKHGFPRDSKSSAGINVNKVWTPKPKQGTAEAENCKTEQTMMVTSQKKTQEVLIGSISVSIGNCTSSQFREEHPGGFKSEQHHALKCSAQEKQVRLDTVMAQGSAHRPVVKLWRPVSRHKNRSGQNSVQSGEHNTEVDVVACSATASNESPGSSPVDCNSGNLMSDLSPFDEGPSLRYSIREAEAFLAQRWKEAIASDHVKVVLLPEPEPSGCTEAQVDPVVIGQGNSGPTKPRIKTLCEKGSEVRYIPKERNPS